MITCVQLCHPQSVELLPNSVFNNKRTKRVKISCGTTKVKNVDYSESNDFYPTYASWNSALFETSVILTVWEHADLLIGNNDVAILHSDITPHFKPLEIWKKINCWLRQDPKRSVGLTIPQSSSHAFNDWTIPRGVYIPKHDPMLMHMFDYKIDVWDHIKKCDYDIYSWCMDTQPQLIYSHQFACTRKTFDYLGDKLYKVVHKLKLQDVGLWTPHVFERLIALYLAKYGGEPVLSTCFLHASSSGSFGPGEFNLYGPRPRKFYKLKTRWSN